MEAGRRPVSDSPASRRPPRFGAILVVGLAVAIVAWLLLREDDKGSSTAEIKAKEVSVEELRQVAGDTDHAVYWAGEQPATKFELTRTESDTSYIRYLGAEDAIGVQEARFLTVATHPYKNAYGALQAVSEQPGAKSQRVAGGGLVYASQARPESVYLAYPGQDYQIEVYDPSAKRAFQLAVSGAVRPID